ncbi:MAG: helix-turn-helix domain-containing protein [Saprospiraceae bacterium]|nr:helix-turn-helix domain-containing protein [Saprospiraceae bacterium]
MISVNQLRAAKKFGPGYFIREQLEQREWTQEDLAAITNLSAKHINKILQDQQPLTLDNARLFADIFGTSVQYWVNLNTDYLLWLRQEKTPEEVEADVKGAIYARMPIKDMIKKGWLESYSNANDLKQQVLDFWGWHSLDFSQLDRQLPFLTRKSDAYNTFNASYALTWYHKATLIAAQRPHRPYRRKQLETLYDQMHRYSITTDGINAFIKALEAAGVIFFVLPHLQKTYLDGAAFFSGANPVLVYTGRYKRIDHFWFTLAHEIAHVLLHLDEATPFILDNLHDGEKDNIEEEANALAARQLKHPEILEQLSPYAKYLPPAKVEECAEQYQVHPAIVIGKLAHEKLISYANQTRYKDDVLELINPEYQYH